MNIKVLRLEDKDKIIEFEQLRLAESIEDPMEREMFSWSAKWRPESLEHYLPLGWSFAIWDEEGSIEGYFLAQPQLFTGGMTQRLWVEYLAFDSEAVGHKLVEVAYKMSREKHFQQALFSGLSDFKSAFVGWPLEESEEGLVVVKTAKYKG